MFDPQEKSISYEITQQARVMGWGDFNSFPYVDHWPNASNPKELRVMLKNVDYAPRHNAQSIYVGASYLEALQKLQTAMPPESAVKLDKLRAENSAKTSAYLQIRKLIEQAGGYVFYNRYRTEGFIELGLNNWYDDTYWEVGDPRSINSPYYKISLVFGRLDKSNRTEPWDCLVETNCQCRLTTAEFQAMIELLHKVNDLSKEIRAILTTSFTT